MRNLSNSKKTIVLICTCLYLSLTATGTPTEPNCQEKTSIRNDTVILNSRPAHMKVKGIQIDGTADNFMTLLRDRGFKLAKDGCYGEFAGHNVTLRTETTEENKLVYRVIMHTNPVRRFDEVKNLYLTYRNNITKKYGKSVTQVWKFQSPYSEGDGFEYKGMLDNKINCENSWITNNGTIHTSIKAISSGFSVCIIYTDKQNFLISEEEMNRKLLNDL